MADDFKYNAKKYRPTSWEPYPQRSTGGDPIFRKTDHTFRYNNSCPKTFKMFDIMFRDQLHLSGDEAMFIQVEHFSVDQFFGESRTKVLKFAHPIMIWKPEKEEDSLAPMFNSGFDLFNIHKQVLYVPISYFNDLKIQPRISDLIWIPTVERLYKVEYVSDTPTYLLMNKDLSYSFTVQLYDYNSDIIVDGQVGDMIPQFDNEALEDLNDLMVEKNNVIIDNEIVSDDVLDETEPQTRVVNTPPINKFKRVE